MINFTTAFAWGILTKWLKTWGNAPSWDPLPSAEVAIIVFWYGFPKGCLQFISGFISDMIGRRFTVGCGLVVCSISIFAMAIVGGTATSHEAV